MARLRISRSLVLVLLGTMILTSILPVTVHSACPITCRYVPSQYPTIQQAINAANINDTIIVSAGTYHERFSLNRTVHIVGASRDTTFLDGQGQGTVVTVTASGASITGSTIQNSDAGGHAVELLNVNNVNITGNVISSSLISSSDNSAGVDMYRSNYTLVDGNIFAHNLFGVNMTLSMHNRVSNNQLVNDDKDAVEVTNSSRNLVFQNNFVGDQDGVDLIGSLTNLNNLTRNLFRGMSFTAVFLLDHPGSLGSNSFVENTFMLNHIGVNMQNATGNVFYHNSFLRSGFRHVNHVFPSDGLGDVWDNRSLGLPRGGNYWDNYTGVDVDNDGIGNSNLPADGLDSYPLMAPFVPVPIAVISVVPSKMSGTVPLTVSFNTDVLGTLKPFTYTWNFGDNSSTSNLAVPSHTFTTVGNYVVTITVKDASGSSSSGTVNVSVVSAPAMGINTYLEAGGVLAAGAAVLGFIYYRRRRRRTNTAPVAAGVRMKGSRRIV